MHVVGDGGQVDLTTLYVLGNLIGASYFRMDCTCFPQVIKPTKSLILKCWLVHTLMCILLLDHFLWLKDHSSTHLFFNFHLWLLIIKCHFEFLLFEIEIYSILRGCKQQQTFTSHDCKNLPVSTAGRKQETEKKGSR